MRRLVLGSGVFAALVLAIAVPAAGCSDDDAPVASTDATQTEDVPFASDEFGNLSGGISVEEAMAFDEFELFWLGEEFMDQRLRGVDRTKHDPPPPEPDTVRTDRVSFYYGDCTPDPNAEGSCSVPITIHVDAFCTRRPDVLLGPHALDDGFDAKTAYLGDGISVWTEDVHISVIASGEGPSTETVVDGLRALDASGRQPGEGFDPIDQAVATSC